MRPPVRAAERRQVGRKWARPTKTVLFLCVYLYLFIHLIHLFIDLIHLIQFMCVFGISSYATGVAQPFQPSAPARVVRPGRSLHALLLTGGSGPSALFPCSPGSSGPRKQVVCLW